MELYIKIKSDDDTGHFPAECNQCGWVGSSGDLGQSKGHPESGCSGDIHCPICNSMDVDETDNEQPLQSWIEKLAKSHKLLKVVLEQLEGSDLEKYIYSHFEEQNKRMAQELEERDNFAIAFAGWVKHDPQAHAYQEAKVSAGELLRLYKDRPYINTDPSKQ